MIIYFSSPFRFVFSDDHVAYHTTAYVNPVRTLMRSGRAWLAIGIALWLVFKHFAIFLYLAFELWIV